MMNNMAVVVVTKHKYYENASLEKTIQKSFQEHLNFLRFDKDFYFKYDFPALPRS